MTRFLSRLAISNRLWLAMGVAVLCLGAVCFDSLQVLKARMMEEKRGRLRASVETVHGILAHYQGLAEAGTLPLGEAQRQALDEVRGLRYAGNEYFTIHDLSPRMVMHPIQRGLDGRDLTDLADPDGKHFVLESTRALVQDPSNGVFSAYRWPKVGSTVPVAKLSYSLGREEADGAGSGGRAD